MRLRWVALLSIFFFALGAYVVPTKTVEKVKIVEVEKKHSEKEKESEKIKHRETTETEITRPDGTVEKTKKTVEDTQTAKKGSESSDSESSKTDERTKETERTGAKVTVSALAGLRLTDLSAPPLVGASVTKPILGPITVGIWGLTNSTIGCSLGLSF